MFKALNNRNQQEIIILGFDDDHLADLRELGHAGTLICPGCRQSVIVKAGAIKRPHFAHKSLSDCPLGNEPPELLEARSVLYDWLKKKPGVRVTIEHNLDGIALPHILDCWAEKDGKRYAYFIVEASHRPDYREALLVAKRKVDAGWTFVFLNRMLREDGPIGTLKLTPTEREMIAPSQYDELYCGGSWNQGSLHYLDEGVRALTTFRHLAPESCCQTYRGFKLISALEDVRVCPKTGEFVHPDEHEKLSAFERRKKEQEAARQEAKRKAEEAAREASERAAEKARLRNEAKQAQPPAVAASTEESPWKPSSLGHWEIPCRKCGCITTNWTVRDPDGTCICRDCRDREAEKTNEQ